MPSQLAVPYVRLRSAPPWRAALVATAVGAGALGLAACGSSSTPADATTSTAEATTTTTVPGGTATVNANSASTEELAAAFDAAGVPNASRWAREVTEYRPYSDDGWAALRTELAKYNIDEATFAKITSVLSL